MEGGAKTSRFDVFTTAEKKERDDKMKRKNVFVLAVLAVALLLGSCAFLPKGMGAASLGAKDATVQRFVNHILDNSYAEAIKVYNTEIVGNAALEKEAEDCVGTYLEKIEDDILSGECTTDEAEIKQSTIQKIYNSTACSPDEYDQLSENIQKALASKVAYQSGISLMESKNYVDAIAEFEKVLPDDTNYTDALLKKEESVQTYKEELSKKVEDALEEKDFLTAIALLEDAAAVLPEDSDILSQLNTCQKNYILKVTEDAAAVFTDYTKYEQALEVIQAALQNDPENETLIAKREYYLSYQPVSLYDMEAVRGETNKLSTDTDTYNNEYEKCFWMGYGEYMIWSGEIDIDYDLNKQYNLFTAKIYGRSGKTDAGQFRVTIIGDGKKLYEKTVKDNGRAVDLSVDVTGISEMSLRVDMVVNPITSGIGLTDMYLQKTAK